MADLPIIYSTSTCGNCARLKTWADSNRIGYDSVNLEENPEKVAEFRASGLRALPIIERNGKFHAGPKGAQEFLTS